MILQKKRMWLLRLLGDSEMTKKKRGMKLMCLITSVPKTQTLKGLVSVLISVISHNQSNRHCIHMLRNFTYGHHISLVFDLLPISLYARNKAYKSSMNDIRIIARQLLEATSFLHSIGVIHTDLKPGKRLKKQFYFLFSNIYNRLANIMFQNESRVDSLKIIDFGSARLGKIQGQKFTGLVTTTWYRAPEVVFGPTWDSKIDVVSYSAIYMYCFLYLILYWFLLMNY